MRRLAPAALLVSGCVVHRGEWAPPPVASPAREHAPLAVDSALAVVGRANVSLVLVGNAGAATRWAQAVGAELDAQLRAEHDAGRTPLVLWLGGMSMSARPDRRDTACPPDRAAAGRAADPITDAVRGHLARGYDSYAVAGATDWRCGDPIAMLQADARRGANPWAMPAHHFVVRVSADGSSRVVSSCTEDPGPTCTITAARPSPTDASPLVDLVMVDLAPWVLTPSQASERMHKDAEVARLDALIAAVRRAPAGQGPPQILVSALPAEAAGFEGMGGGGASAAFHFLPPSMQSALRDGVFAGVLGGHDRALYATADITHAVKRSSRAWLSRPVFQVVSGSASLPDSRPAAGARRLRYFRSNTHHADAYSDRPGFAVVYLTPDRVRAVLHAERRGHWEQAAVEAPLRPPQHPTETPAPPLTPCQHCPMIPSEER